VKILSASELKERLKEYLDCPSVFWDSEYRLVSDPVELTQITQRFLRLRRDFKLRYEPDWFDCDDFARAYKFSCLLSGINAIGWAVGRVKVLDKEYGHSFNLLPVVWDGEFVLFLVEPQYDLPAFVQVRDGRARLRHLEYKVEWVEW